MATVAAPQAHDDQFTTLFCRALYDYEAQDASSLSFSQNDIIEVLTQQPSGWWDGLLGDERGWFPSNYVTIISDEEAEAAFANLEYERARAESRAATVTNHNPVDNGVIDMGLALMRGNQSESEDWSDSEYMNSRGIPGPGLGTGRFKVGSPPAVVGHTHAKSQSNDFWVPQVAQDGRIFYVNTQTGQRSRDLPQEPEDYISDGDLAGLTSQSSSRSGTSAGLGFASSESETSSSVPSVPNFGALQRPGTPEPWVRKLADDRLTYYYYNKIDGTTRWDKPELAPVRTIPPMQPTKVAQPRAPPIKHSSTNGNGPNITSDISEMYSDDEISEPPNQNLFRQPTNGRPRKSPSLQEEHVVMQLTSAEKIAQSLQKALSPTPAELVTDLSGFARRAIQDVVESIKETALNNRPYQDFKMDILINKAVDAVRNLLYISSAPVGQIPSHVLPQEARDYRPHPSHTALKPAQRKVTATLSRLVLSARAIQYDSGTSTIETLNRLEFDAEELERAVSSFVLEVQRTQHATLPEDQKAPKRLHGVFETANIGLGLVGAGAAGGWKGFGWLSLSEEATTPKTLLRTEVIASLDAHIAQVEPLFTALLDTIQLSDERAIEQARLRGQELVTRLSSFLTFAADIHVARHVDVDGIRQDAGSPTNDLYIQNVEKARVLVRTLEASVQATYDESALLFSVTQKLVDSEPGQPSLERDAATETLESLSSSLQANVNVVKGTLEALLSVGHDQADMARGDYTGSIEWRISRLSVIDNRFGGAVRANSPTLGEEPSAEEDVINIEDIIAKPVKGPRLPQSEPLYNSYADQDDFTSVETGSTTIRDTRPSMDTAVDYEEDADLDSDEGEVPEMPRKQKSKNLRSVLGEGYENATKPPPPPPLPPAAPEPQPWYLEPNYDPAEIAIDPDKSVRGGTVPALVERLTAHEQGDSKFIKTFLMTYKSFTTLDELFDLLVARFRIQPPEALTPPELEKWTKLKQHIIQMRVINTLKAMVVDEDILEKEDLYILDRMKDFISSEEVSKFGAAKGLLILIERLQRGGGAIPKTAATQGLPPPSILPKSNRALKLLDIDATELARQLTIMESQLYQKIKPMECLQRAREQRTENVDNITVVIQTSNRIADWVADSILSKEDSRRRAATVKHLISVADRCRALNNFSTMIAITSGLNTPPIRRLKRTWEQVNQRFMAQFAACEMTIDSNKNFNKYRQLMANVTPPCVPFIGVFLSTLQFIQDGNPDNHPGGLVNFRKRQKAAEVIDDIKRWQAQQFNFTPVRPILDYIDESLNKFNDTREQSDLFWNLSLEREPREREDEKMARLLQESGFL
ncbi:ras GEF [Pluteus cervinus]|uniref:Ras GEF n=1 Tax=Pluteus cervinus TaxID=181527 RepID=A0ACD3B9C3_9AGAR|nr:ras GEF [Pluteus cervinus]